jgi:hypothetical protein
MKDPKLNAYNTRLQDPHCGPHVKGGDMSRCMMLGLAVAVLAGCSSVREGDEYIATDTPGASATVQAQKSCAGSGLALEELRRFQIYSSDQGRMVDRLYYTCVKSGQ